VTSIAITVTRMFFNLAAYARIYSPELEVKILRVLNQPTPVIDSVDEKIIELEDFQIHVFTPKSYTGG